MSSSNSFLRIPFTHSMIFAGMLAIGGSLSADLTTFDNLTAGQSINGQGGWTVEGPFNDNVELFDEEVVTVEGSNNAWRISNSYTSTTFSNQPYSSKSAVAAGEAGAGLYNDYGPNGATPYTPPHSSATAASRYFRGSWDFTSATGAAQGDSESTMSIGISAGASLGTSRLTGLSIVDAGSGFELSYYYTYDGANWGGQTIATGLSYDEWHSVEMYIEFVDGVVDSMGNAYVDGVSDGVYGNDIVTIMLDGSVIHTSTTWESYYYVTTEGGFTPPTPQAVDSLLFRMNGDENVENEGYGFLFDNVNVDNALVPEPSDIAQIAGSIVLGLVLLMRLYRRREAHMQRV